MVYIYTVYIYTYKPSANRDQPGIHRSIGAPIDAIDPLDKSETRKPTICKA